MQPLLFDNLTIQARYERWRHENPRTFDLFRQFAMRALASGRRIGIKAIAERVRWEAVIEWGGDYKINNNFTSRIARDLIAEEPRLRDVIELRTLKAE